MNRNQSAVFLVTISAVVLATTLLILYFLSTLPLTIGPIALLIPVSMVALTYLGIKNDTERTFRIDIGNRLPWELLIVGIWAALLILALLPRETMSLIFVPWESLDVLDLILSVFFLPLTSFFPGYAILKVGFDDMDLGIPVKLLIAYILSWFTSALSGYVSVLFFRSSGFAGTIHLALSIILLALLSLRILLETPIEDSETIEVPLSLVLVLVPIIIVVLASTIVSNFPFIAVPYNDQWVIFGATLRMMDSTVAYSFPYYWPQLHYSTVLGISRINAMNTYMFLPFFSILTPFCFYYFARAFVDSRIAVLSTLVYTLFSGLGWIAIIGLTTIQYSDLAFLGDEMGLHPMVRPLFFIYPKIFSSACIFIAMYLAFRKNRGNGNWKTPLLIGTLIAISYLWHLLEALLLIYMLVPLAIIIYRERDSVRLLTTGSAFGMVLIAIFGTMNSDIWSSNFPRLFPVYLSPLVIVAISAIIISFVVLLLRSRVSFDLGRYQRITDMASSRRLAGVVSGVLLMISAVLVIQGLADLYQSISDLYAMRLNLYPVKLGISLFLFVAAIGIAHEESRPMTIAITFVAIIFLVGHTYGYILSLTASEGNTILFHDLSIPILPEWRFVRQYWHWIALAAGIAIHRIISLGRIKMPRIRPQLPKIASITIILCISLVGVWDTVLVTDYVMRDTYASISQEELGGISFLNNLPSIGTCLAPGLSISNPRIVTRFTKLILDSYNNDVFSSTTPEELALLASILYRESIGMVPVYYFELDRLRNTLDYHAEEYFYQYIVSFLQFMYQDEFSRVGSVPTFFPPDDSPRILLLVPSLHDSSYSEYSDAFYTHFLPANMLMFSGTSYDVRTESDLRIDEQTSFIISSNLSLASEPYIVSWINNGNTFILLNTTMPYASSIRLGAADELVAAGSEVNCTSVEVDYSLEVSPDWSILAWYYNKDVPVSPLATSKKSGAGEIWTLKMWPFTNLLNPMFGQDVPWLVANALTKIPFLLSLPRFHDVSEQIELEIVYSPLNCVGNISIESTSLVLRNCPITSFVLDYQNGTLFEHPLELATVIRNLALRGTYSISISTSSCRLSTNHYTWYSTLSSSDAIHVEIDLSAGSLARFDLISSAQTNSIEIGEGMIHFVLDSPNRQVALNLKSAVFSVEGQVSYFDRNLQRRSASGLIEFQILGSGSSIICSEWSVEHPSP
ncbi:MAG: hypothetical protein EAX81_01235 [Candidatus Thorarchaeota archaeon]|nr:hypothetical protein [Candidatus Thorarchaeota archaeon]